MTISVLKFVNERFYFTKNSQDDSSFCITLTTTKQKEISKNVRLNKKKKIHFQFVFYTIKIKKQQKHTFSYNNNLTFAQMTIYNTTYSFQAPAQSSLLVLLGLHDGSSLFGTKSHSRGSIASPTPL